MHFSAFESSPLNLANMSSFDVEAHLAHDTRLVVPLGGLEPLGREVPLGTMSMVAEAVCVGAAAPLGVAFVPSWSLSCSLFASAFAGGAGVRPRTLVNMLCDTVRPWIRQGFTRVTIADMSWGSASAIAEAVSRLDGEYGAGVRAWRWHDGQEVRTALQQRLATLEPGRFEFGLLSMARHLDPRDVRRAAARDTHFGDSMSLATWVKRGADPEQFAKRWPHAMMTPAGLDPDATFGAQLLTLSTSSLAAVLR